MSNFKVGDWVKQTQNCSITKIGTIYKVFECRCTLCIVLNIDGDSCTLQSYWELCKGQRFIEEQESEYITVTRSWVDKLIDIVESIKEDHPNDSTVSFLSGYVHSIDERIVTPEPESKGKDCRCIPVSSTVRFICSANNCINS